LKDDFFVEAAPSTPTKPTIFDIVKGGHWEALEAAMLEADVNAQDGNGMTILHHAAARGARPCIRILVASGRCDYLVQDACGHYASDLAILSAEDFAIARLLSKHQMRQADRQGVPAFVHPRLG